MEPCKNIYSFYTQYSNLPLFHHSNSMEVFDAISCDFNNRIKNLESKGKGEGEGYL